MVNTGPGPAGLPEAALGGRTVALETVPGGVDPGAGTLAGHGAAVLRRA